MPYNQAAQVPLLLGDLEQDSLTLLFDGKDYLPADSSPRRADGKTEAKI